MLSLTFYTGNTSGLPQEYDAMKQNSRMILAAVSAALLSGCFCNVSGWGRIGHDAVCYIAEQNLSPKARKVISGYLGGNSIVEYSSWMDEVRDWPEYRYTTKWHSAYVDESGEPCLGRNFKEGEYKGDAVLELLRLMERMGDWRELDDSTVAVGIKMIVHLVADMHCPGHVKYPGVKGFKVIYSGNEVTYHYVWDDAMLEKMNKWGFMEYGYMLGNLSRSQARMISAGTPVDWERENARECRVIYDWAAPGDDLRKEFNLKAKALADRQIQKAGYRLAAVLNSIFG